MSGINNAIVDKNTIPQEIKRWNWGAFLLSWIWGLAHKTYVSLLVFVPFIGFAVPFILGIKGNEWAWKNGEWQSVEEFLKSQRNWARAGVALVAGFVILMLIIIGVVFAGISNIEPVDKALEIVNSNSEAINVLGKPIEKGFFVSGSVHVSGPSGSADLAIPVKGINAKGTIYLKATKYMDSWNINKLVLYIEGKDEEVDLLRAYK